MTLDHLNKKFLQSNPYDATPYGTALIKEIRNTLLIHRYHSIVAGDVAFNWLLKTTGAAPTATNLGKRFLRVTKDDNIIDVFEN